jgi:hypothetical protein
MICGPRRIAFLSEGFESNIEKDHQFLDFGLPLYLSTPPILNARVDNIELQRCHSQLAQSFNPELCP